jgi:Holliday junction resolvase RusA-like endonuclease
VTSIEFTVYEHPESQGSIKSFSLVDKSAVEALARTFANRPPNYDTAYEMIYKACQKTRAILTSDNADLKKYRKAVADAATRAIKIAGLPIPLIEKTTAVKISLHFVFLRPESVKAHKRPYPVVKPDIDKLMRAVLDSLTGVVYVDDSQVVEGGKITKMYGPQECVTVWVESIEDAPMLPLEIPLQPPPPPAPKKTEIPW